MNCLVDAAIFGKKGITDSVTRQFLDAQLSKKQRAKSQREGPVREKKPKRLSIC